MDALLVGCALLTVLDGFPPEPVCKLAYEQVKAEEEYAQQLYDVGGSWPLKQQLEVARRRTRYWYAAWYVVWPQATFADRLHWALRALAIAGGDERY